MKAVGVIIARFQTPYLHEGHKALITYVKEKHNKVVVFLGIAGNKGTHRNPYDYFTREMMLKGAYPELTILPLRDQPSDKLWSQNLDSTLRETFPGEKMVLYGGRDSFIPHYQGKNDVEEIPSLKEFSATQIRYEISDLVRNSEDFRAGVLYAVHQNFPKVYPTVDVAVFRNGYKELLLGKKPIEDSWRLIGGFVDPEDDSFEIAAKREFREECKGIEISGLHSVGTTKINSWRYRGEKDQIITTLFVAEYLSGKGEADDDLEKVEWIAVDEIVNEGFKKRITPEHWPLMEMLVNWLEKKLKMV